MASLKTLAKDTAVYGISSIVGRFLNYLLVPLYTHCIPASNGGYGVVTQLYAYTALFLVILTFGMETTFFRFVYKDEHHPHTVFSTAFGTIALLSTTFFLLIVAFLQPITSFLGQDIQSNYVLIMACVVALDALQAIPFCYLRYQRKAIHFSLLKLLFILLNIGLNLLFFVYLKQTEVFYIFLLNLLCTALILFTFAPSLFRIKWCFDLNLFKQMIGYSWPILLLGITGILNQAADKMIFPLAYPYPALAAKELGIYGACVKIAMIMAMITQAFRFAYEPFVFSQSQASDKRQTYALGMKYFIVFTLLAFLCVIAYLPVLKYLVGSDYWPGLRTVPIVMVAEIMMGVYFNLSFWYKLTDQTLYGALFSLVGCIVLVLVNILLIPSMGYMACAWGGLAGYTTSMLISYLVGQKKYPIPYPLKSIAIYIAIAAFFYFIMEQVPESWSLLARLSINSVLVLAFIAHIIYHDLPIEHIPFLRKIKRKRTT